MDFASYFSKMAESPQSDPKQAVWFMCSVCQRCFKDADKMLEHKYKDHPELLKHEKPKPKRKRRVDEAKSADTTKQDNLPKETLKVVTSEKNPPSKARKSTGSKIGPTHRMKVGTSTTSSMTVGSSNSNDGEQKGEGTVKKPKIRKTVPPRTSKPKDSKTQAKAGDEVLKQVEVKEKSKKTTLKKKREDILVPKSSPPLKIPDSPKAKIPEVDAFKKMFLNSLKNALDDKCRNSLSTKVASPKQQGSSHTAESKFKCLQCHRVLDSMENYKSHMVLHKGILISSVNGAPPAKPLTEPCKLCGRILSGPPFKCIGCPNEKITFDIPSKKIKEERDPQESWDENNIIDPSEVLELTDIRSVADRVEISTSGRFSLKAGTDQSRSPLLRTIGSVESKEGGRHRLIQTAKTSQIGKRISSTGAKKESTKKVSSQSLGDARLYQCNLCQKKFQNSNICELHIRAHMIPTNLG